MGKNIEKVFLTAIAVAVLCAGTVSARQLQNHAATSAVCGATCSVRVPCSSVFCFCSIPSGAVAGTCIVKPASAK
jgi:hypothetical protein